MIGSTCERESLLRARLPFELLLRARLLFLSPGRSVFFILPPAFLFPSFPPFPSFPAFFWLAGTAGFFFPSSCSPCANSHSSDFFRQVPAEKNLQSLIFSSCGSCTCWPISSLPCAHPHHSPLSQWPSRQYLHRCFFVFTFATSAFSSSFSSPPPGAASAFFDASCSFSSSPPAAAASVSS